MSHKDEPAYYWIRAAEELECGDQAIDSTIASVHYELAYRYGVLAAEMKSGVVGAVPADLVELRISA